MIDADALKQQVDYHAYILARLGPGKPEGRTIMAWRSPFRDGDNDPSFKHKVGHLYAKDYGTNQIFDIYSFIQEIDNVGFADAVKILNEWAGGKSAKLVVRTSPPVKEATYPTVTWDDVVYSEKNYPYVKDYIEKHRGISEDVAHLSHIGAIKWSKVISFRGKTKRMPIYRATFPYYYGGAVHCIMSRLDDLRTIETMEDEFNGIISSTIANIWASDPTRDVKTISEKEVLAAIHDNMWTPEKYRDDPISRISMLRWHQNGRRSIFNADRFCRVIDGVYHWDTPVIIVHESETDALACQSVSSRSVANIAYKPHNPINVPFWKVLGVKPVIVMIAVQNDQASENYANQLAERLAYSKENYGKSSYVVQFLRTPKGYKDFGEMQQRGVLKKFFDRMHLGAG